MPTLSMVRATIWFEVLQQVTMRGTMYTEMCQRVKNRIELFKVPVPDIPNCTWYCMRGPPNWSTTSCGRSEEQDPSTGAGRILHGAAAILRGRIIRHPHESLRRDQSL